MANEQVIVFKLLEQEFGVNIMDILEIQNYIPIRPLPGVPSYIRGIINVRGTVFTIFDLRSRLGIKERENDNDCKIILLNLTDKSVGFLVDSVTEILTAQPEEIEQASDLIKNNSSNCIEHIIKQPDRMIILLNVASIISEEKEIKLEGVLNEDHNCSDAESR